MVSRMLRKSRWRSLVSTAMAMFAGYLDQREKSRNNGGKGARRKAVKDPNGILGRDEHSSSTAQGTTNGRNARRQNIGKGKKLSIPKDFFDDYAAADGWDPKKYVKIVNEAKTRGGGNGSGGNGECGNGGGGSGGG
jgi:uncharacterized membrane protein YgcG